MKLIIAMLVVAFILPVSAGNLYMDRTAHISFYSDATLEKIEAHNRQCSSVMDISKGTIVFKAVIKSFEFKNASMQEHFNENYMESDTYENAIFDGKITNLTEVNFAKNGTYTAKVAGKLTMHGVTKDITATGTIKVEDGKYHIDCKFQVKTKDYNIKIPQAVVGKIADTIDITVDATLTEYIR